ncbi:MAG TPA: homoserine kinase [Chthoniobacterales bacterium]
MSTVQIRVPASTSNLGPGFDCLGLALQLYNDVRVELAGEPEPAAFLTAVASAFFARTGLPPFNVRVRVSGGVPSARGLGSSVTVRLGLLMGLNALANGGLERESLFRLAAELEGHPDNAAAACYGGFTIVRPHGSAVLRYEVKPALKVVLCVPDFEVQTPAARQALPESYPRQAVVGNLAGVAAVTAAFVSQDYRLLRGAFRDQVHQPYRQPLVPFLPSVLRAAEEAGALGGFLSGSGSTIACIALENTAAVAAAMQSAVPGGTAAMHVVEADNAGARIVTA